MFNFRILSRKGMIAAALACILVLAGCAGSQTDHTDKAVKGGTLTYGRPASVTSFDLFKEITSNNAFAIDKVFEPLVSFDKNGKIINWLAQSHRVSSDGLTYTFTLRNGLKFSNGKAVTAADAAFSLKHHLAVGGPLAIEAQVASVTAKNKQTLVIKLKKPFTPFLAELANFSNGIVPANFDGKTEKAFFKKPVGTGPFTVQKWDPDGDLTFTKNTHYWQKGKPYIDKLVFKTIADDTQAVNQLRSGEISATESIPLENAKALAKGSGTQVQTNGSWVTEQLFFNTLDKHFADRHVRRALALALNRDGLTKAVTFGYAQTAKALLPTTIPYNSNKSIKSLDYDVKAARKELAQSAYSKGFTTKLLIASGNGAVAQEAQIIQAAAKTIGIHIQIQSVDLAAFRARFFAYNFSMMINSGQADFPDADSILAFQTDPKGFSKSYWTHYTNPAVTKLLYEGEQTADGSKRAKIYAQLQQILANDVPYIPLYYPDVVIAHRSNVKGLVVLPNGSVRFENAYVK
ncbi:MAG: ABC transporter substrate-binding protein [Sporolactobacillus sp.]